MQDKPTLPLHKSDASLQRGYMLGDEVGEITDHLIVCTMTQPAIRLDADFQSKGLHELVCLLAELKGNDSIRAT